MRGHGAFSSRNDERDGRRRSWPGRGVHTLARGEEGGPLLSYSRARASIGTPAACLPGPCRLMSLSRVAMSGAGVGVPRAWHWKAFGRVNNAEWHNRDDAGGRRWRLPRAPPCALAVDTTIDGGVWRGARRGGRGDKDKTCSPRGGGLRGLGAGLLRRELCDKKIGLRDHCGHLDLGAG